MGLLAIPPSGIAWVHISLAGAVMALGHAMMVSAIHWIGATKMSIINLLEPLTSVIAGVVVFGDLMTKLEVLGCLLILVAVLLISTDGEKYRSRLVDNEKKL